MTEPPGEHPNTHEAQAVRTRHTFGLRSDLTHVREVERDPDADRSELGVALTAEETATIRSRQRRLERDVPALHALVDSWPNGAGVWIDQRADGLVHVCAVAPTAAQRTAAHAAASAPERVTVDAVRWTSADLHEASQVMVQLMTTVFTGVVGSSGYRARNNLITVYPSTRATDDDLTALARALEAAGVRERIDISEQRATFSFD